MGSPESVVSSRPPANATHHGVPGYRNYRTTEAVQAVAICPTCNGEGEVHIQGMSLSPFSGVNVADPQMDDYTVCPACHGTGERA